MRWAEPLFTGAILRRSIPLAAGILYSVASSDAQVIDLGPQKQISVAQVTIVTQQSESVPLPPSEFNPDPGAYSRDEIEPEEQPPELFPPILPQLPNYGEEALPRSLELPRKGVRE